MSSKKVNIELDYDDIAKFSSSGYKLAEIQSDTCVSQQRKKRSGKENRRVYFARK